jgi:hypothetical protein
LVANASLAFDLCHQPDMAYLDGFIMSPSFVRLTHTPFAIFSQARVGGFSDILMPSPWNFIDKSSYHEDSDIAWTDKQNDLFWRGSSTDGFAAGGAWQSFIRARFVHEANEKMTTYGPQETAPAVNVSFVGDIKRCDERDCENELKQFAIWGKAAMGSEDEKQGRRLPPSTSFEEHWRHRHLADMDGAGFSGRFLPFLQSRSLVYRVAVFKTWLDQRLQAWHHYVPVDVRLGQSLWAVFEYFSGHGEEIGPGQAAAGDDSARIIAEQGREWAQAALRKEDMQIYMFRLLLEWGRVVDDERERLGFSLDQL